WGSFVSGKEIAGFGYVNPHSLIGGRLLLTQKTMGLKTQDEDGSTNRRDIIEKLLEKSLAKRKDLLSVGSFRAVFSEADEIPGLIVDVYDGEERTVVALSSTAGIDDAI